MGEFNSYCLSVQNMHIRGDSSLLFEWVWCFNEELDCISNALQKTCMYVCVALTEFELSLASLPRCNERPYWLLLLSPPRLLHVRFKEGEYDMVSTPALQFFGFSPRTWVGGRKMTSFCRGKAACRVPVVTTSLCMIFPRFFETCRDF